MTPTDNQSEDMLASQEVFEQMVQERMRYAVRVALMSILEEEVKACLGARPSERNAQRQDQRHGHDTRNRETTVGQIADVPVPRTRAGHQTQLFERSHRRRDEWDGAIGEMFVKGVSTAKVGEVIETLTGSHPSASTGSRVFHPLEEEEEPWKQRPLDERYPSAFADGTDVTVISNGDGWTMPIVAVVGMSTKGEREVLAFRVGDREKQQAWEGRFDDLKERGVKQVDLWISDGTQAMINAMTATCRSSQRQRCVMHTRENVLGSVPATQRDQVEPEWKAFFSQNNRQEAEQAVAAFGENYQKMYPTAIECLQRDLEACLTFDSFPKAHGKTIRTSHVIERLFGEVKRRSQKMAAAFRHEGSCVLLFSAVIRRLTFNRLTMPPASQAQPDPEILHTT